MRPDVLERLERLEAAEADLTRLADAARAVKSAGPYGTTLMSRHQALQCQAVWEQAARKTLNAGAAGVAEVRQGRAAARSIAHHPDLRGRHERP